MPPGPRSGGLTASAGAQGGALLLPSGGGPARRGRTRRGGRGRPRGRRGGGGSTGVGEITGERGDRGVGRCVLRC